MKQFAQFKRRFSYLSGSGLDFRRRRSRVDVRRVRWLLILIAQLVLVILLAFSIVFFFGKRITVAGESMEDTINDEDFVLLDRLSYVFFSPKAGDLVAFLPKGNLSAQYSVKRVIGVPGDTVLISGGDVYINGELYDDISGVDDIEDAGLASTEITLGEDEYFLLGDNRNNSEDSRYVTIGNVELDEIVGRVWFDVTWSNFGFLF